ncbi:MAG: DUF2292 domain-containing protein [Bacillota bacterium]
MKKAKVINMNHPDKDLYLGDVGKVVLEEKNKVVLDFENGSSNIVFNKNEIEFINNIDEILEEAKEELNNIEFGHVKITKQHGEIVFIETKETKKVK